MQTRIRKVIFLWRSGIPETEFKMHLPQFIWDVVGILHKHDHWWLRVCRTSSSSIDRSINGDIMVLFWVAQIRDFVGELKAPILVGSRSGDVVMSTQNARGCSVFSGYSDPVTKGLDDNGVDVDCGTEPGCSMIDFVFSKSTSVKAGCEGNKIHTYCIRNWQKLDW